MLPARLIWTAREEAACEGSARMGGVYIVCVKRDTVTAKCELRLVTQPIRERSRPGRRNKGKTATDEGEQATPAPC